MDNLNNRTLIALFELSQMDQRPSVAAVAEHLGSTLRQVAESLSALDRAGLVRAETVRLTFLGLARAAGLRARMGQTLAA